MADGFGATQQQIQNAQIDVLLDRISELERRIDYVDSDNFRPEAPGSRQGEDTSNDILAKNVEKITWGEYFYTSEVEPFDTALTPGGPRIKSETSDGKFFSADKETLFRTVVNLLLLPVGTTIYITTLHLRPVDVSYELGDSTGSFVGFKIENNILYGVTFRLGTETLTQLRTGIAQRDDLVLELRFFPRDRVDFYVDGAYVASSADTLPSGSNGVFDVIHYQTYGSGSAVDLQVFEFLQRRT